MATKGKAKVSASFARERARIKSKRAREKPFSLGELAEALNLAPYVASVRVRRESAREPFRGEHMQESGEGEPFPFRELRVGVARCKERGERKAEA